MDTPIEPPESTTELTASDLVAFNLIRKADAGAQLFYAIYHHPRAVELLKEFDTKGFTSAYAQAFEAFGVVKH